MKHDVFTFLIGGKAGEGVKKAGSVAAALFSKMGRSVFQMDDYQSLIRGGHNFSVISTAKDSINSHYMKADCVVALDEKSVSLHKEHTADNGIFVYNSDAAPDADGIGIPMLTEAKKFPDPKMRIGVSGAGVLASFMLQSMRCFAMILPSLYSVGLLLTGLKTSLFRIVM